MTTIKLSQLVKLIWDRPPADALYNWHDVDISYVWNHKEAQEDELTLTTGGGPTRAGAVICTPDIVHWVAEEGYRPVIAHPDPRWAASVCAQPFLVPEDWGPTGSGAWVNLPYVSYHDTASLGHGAVIGKAGFGPVTNPATGKRELMTHLGSVLIGPGVSVGANTTIDRGTFSNTVIGANTQIDNLVHIGHNAQIGQNVIITAGAIVGGSAVIEDDAWIGLNATIMQGVRIGQGATIGIGAVVLRDVEPGQTVVGHHRVIEAKEHQRGVIR